MKRIKLIVAYDGTNYCGWQIQNNGRTIEEVLNEALTALLHEKVAPSRPAGLIPVCTRREM